MKALNKSGLSLVEMMLTLGIVAIIGAASFKVLKSGSSSTEKILRAADSDQLMMLFLNARKKELQLTQSVPSFLGGDDLILPTYFVVNPATEKIVIVQATTRVIGLPVPAMGDACHVRLPGNVVGDVTVYTNAGNGCFKENTLTWKGLTVKRRIEDNSGVNFLDFTYVSRCMRPEDTIPTPSPLPSPAPSPAAVTAQVHYPSHFPRNVGVLGCPEGQTAFIMNGLLPGAKRVFPDPGITNLAGTLPLAASLMVKRSGRTMTLSLTAVIADGKGGFETRTKEVASTIPAIGDSPPRVQIIR